MTMTTIPYDDAELARLDAEKLAIEAAMREAVNDAVRLHKSLGLPMVEWRDGQVKWVPADQLVVDESNPSH
jgi:hypothetical protein